MVKLSVRQFKEACDSLLATEFIFASENQPWNKVEHTLSVKLTFKIMLIALNPNTICFKNGDDYLKLDRVKCVKMYDEKCMIGAVFTVICGDTRNNSNDVEYTVIVR